MSPKTRSGRLILHVAIAILVALTLSAIAWTARAVYAFRDRNPGYALSLEIDGKASLAKPRPIRAGFGRAKGDSHRVPHYEKE